jgi:hypothetical protein
MREITPETQKTRKERLATVIAIGASALIHLFVFIGGIQLYRWAEEEERRERLMVVHRVPEAPPEEPRPSAPAPSRPQAPPEAKVKEESPEPPKEDSAVSDEGEPADLSETEEVPLDEPEERNETLIIVATNRTDATFTVTGPIEFHGRGTNKSHKGAPPGDYTATFHPLPGFKTPPIVKKDLAAKGTAYFKGIYGESVEVSVKINSVPGATFDIIRPDGLKLGMKTPGKAFFENLPTGNYRIVWHDVPGFITPAPQTRAFGKGGGGLDFEGRYLPGSGGRKPQEKPKVAEAALDRRVQMIVKSYPQTSVEENFDYIRYPEIIIKRSNFQSGWCRVYLVLSIDSGGNVSRVAIERPKPAERQQYNALIGAVESAVRRWRYENTKAEVHVDVRFYVE